MEDIFQYTLHLHRLDLSLLSHIKLDASGTVHYALANCNIKTRKIVGHGRLVCVALLIKKNCSASAIFWVQVLCRPNNENVIVKVV